MRPPLWSEAPLTMHALAMLRARVEELTLSGTLQRTNEVHEKGEEYVDRLATHRESVCVGQFCSVHNPSDHPLSNALRLWFPVRRQMLRVCDHDWPHPDPDDLAHAARTRGAEWGHGLHECCPDRCCGLSQGGTLEGELVHDRKEIEG